MHWRTRILVSIVPFAVPFLVFAGDGYIGENPSFDFYTRVDNGNFRIQEKLMQTRLKDYSTLNDFVKQGRTDCDKEKILPEGIVMDRKYLDDPYALTEQLKGKQVSADNFLKFTSCLAEKYNTLKREVKSDQITTEKLSSIGIYSDGDTTNSDYDIMADINKINGLIFDDKTEYQGAPNRSLLSLNNLFAGKPTTVSPNFADVLGFPTGTPLVISPSGNVIPSGNTPGSPSPSAPSGNTNPSGNIDASLGVNCTGTTNTLPSGLIDSDLASSIAAVSQWGTSNPGVDTAGNIFSIAEQLGFLTGNPPHATSPSPSTNPTTGGGGGDFFPTLPCTSIFCIRFKAVPAPGGMTIRDPASSIEGLFKKHTDILEPIVKSSLAYNKMTRQTYTKNNPLLSLVNQLKNGLIKIGDSPQRSPKDKRDYDENQKKSEFENIRRCGAGAVGISSENRGNGFGGEAYIFRAPRSTDTVKKDLSTTEIIDTDKLNGGIIECIGVLTQDTQKKYYESFSQNITEVQTFTASMRDEILNLIDIITKLKNTKAK